MLFIAHYKLRISFIAKGSSESFSLLKIQINKSTFYKFSTATKGTERGEIFLDLMVINLALLLATVVLGFDDALICKCNISFGLVVA